MPSIVTIERALSRPGWWVWISAVTERFLTVEPLPLFVPDWEWQR